MALEYIKKILADLNWERGARAKEEIHFVDSWGRITKYVIRTPGGTFTLKIPK